MSEINNPVNVSYDTLTTALKLKRYSSIPVESVISNTVREVGSMYTSESLGLYAINMTNQNSISQFNGLKEGSICTIVGKNTDGRSYFLTDSVKRTSFQYNGNTFEYLYAGTVVINRDEVIGSHASLYLNGISWLISNNGNLLPAWMSSSNPVNYYGGINFTSGCTVDSVTFLEPINRVNIYEIDDFDVCNNSISISSRYYVADLPHFTNTAVTFSPNTYICDSYLFNSNELPYIDISSDNINGVIGSYSSEELRFITSYKDYSLGVSVSKTYHQMEPKLSRCLHIDFTKFQNNSNILPIELVVYYIPKRD